MLNRITKENLQRIIYSSTPIDKIHSIHETRDFIEVMGTAGGDSCTYRIYNNGKVVEK